jgi:Uma2 family endonuclease
MVTTSLLPDESVEHDNYIVLSGATWADYQRILEVRGDHSAPRITFSDGELQIMSPSRRHEHIKSAVGCLVEVYCLEAGIDFNPVGSWTLEDEALQKGAEPDESYCFGPTEGVERPDLAIEVVWTSGGIRKLTVYRALGVREVWYWRRGKLTAWILGPDGYDERDTSVVLPGIDLAELASYVDRPLVSTAMREYRDALRVRVTRETTPRI